jgi:hypothetical protein
MWPKTNTIKSTFKDVPCIRSKVFAVSDRQRRVPGIYQLIQCHVSLFPVPPHILEAELFQNAVNEPFKSFQHVCSFPVEQVHSLLLCFLCK